MEELNNNNLTENQMQNLQQSDTDEHEKLHIQGHIKIFDPETNEVLLQKRA